MKLVKHAALVIAMAAGVAGCGSGSDAPPEIREFSVQQTDQILAEVEQARVEVKEQALRQFPDTDWMGEPIRGNAQRRRTYFYSLADEANKRIGERWDVTMTQISLIDQYRSASGESADDPE